MKKIFLALVMAFFAFGATAQVVAVSNGDFESWDAGVPASWTTNISGNVMVGFFGVPVSVDFGSKSTDAHSGSYALKLMADNFGIPSTDYNFLLPGVAQLGSASQFSVPLSTIMEVVNGGLDSLGADDFQSLATLLNAVASGEPCTQTPRHVSLWVKYMPDGADTMRVIAFTKSGGTPVSYAMYESSETMSDYTHLEVMFDQPGAECDSVCIIVVSGGMTTSENTELYLDDVTLVNYVDGVEDQEPMQLKIYPNPATEDFTIVTTSSKSYQYKMMDLTGRVVAADANVVGPSHIDVRQMAPGVYMLAIEQNGSTLTRKIVVR